MYLQAIDAVHHVKTTFLNSFIKDKELNKSLSDLIDAEANFGRSLVKAITEVQFSINDSFYKPASWLKS